MHIVMVAGEVSGDILGAGLIKALKKHYPQAQFSGVGGARMQALGFNSLFPMDRLSVMGLVEPLRRLPELLRIRKAIKQHCLNTQATLFIGIDSPDFNLSIEQFAKQHGIFSVHYVSPSVWAWRQGRIKKIKRSVDLMLCLLPFEVEFYQQHGQAAVFVGHPLADELAMHPDQQAARRQLNIAKEAKVLALMPGSRQSEVALMGQLYLQVAQKLQENYPNEHWQFVLPTANAERKNQLQQIIAQQAFDNVRLLEGQSHLAMTAADAVLLTSGTTALEAMLLKKPMVVAYKTAFLSYAILSRMVKTPYISLPNLLAKQALVPELIQQQASFSAIFSATEKALFDEAYRQQQVQHFYQLHQYIQADASAVAAQAIKEAIPSLH